MRIGYVRVSTASGEQLSALDAQRRRIEAEGCDLILSDVESGLSPTRPSYQELRRLIENGSAREVVAVRLDRLGREATESDQLVALCDRQRVVCRTLDDGVLSMATPEDLLLTRLKGSLAQGESMKISARVRKAYGEGRRTGRPMRKPCWGYRLSSDRLALEPDPETFPLAQRFLSLLRANNWRMQPSLEAFPHPTPFGSVRAVRTWLMNPTLRGGIGYGRQGWGGHAEVIWDRHEELISHAEYAEIERAFAANSRMWGANAARQRRMLSGLCRCAECGRRMTYVGGRTIPQLSCRSLGCSQQYRATREEKVIRWLIPRLAASAAEAIARQVEQEEPPEAQEIRGQIERLERLADPDLLPVVAAKQQRLEALLQRPQADGDLLGKLSDPRFYDLASYAELTEIVQRMVEEVTVTRQEPTAIRLRL